MSKAV
ncbi:hypothetical protein MP638_006860 [Amoeboaphelidium occidentale]|jgi:hypothetical protein